MSVATAEVVVAVLTFRRPRELAHLLPLVLAQVNDLNAGVGPYRAGVLVIDNDPAASAKVQVDEFGAAVRYVCETEAGISAARNRALDEADSADLLVFIDDDEWPRENWLRLILQTYRNCGATAVAGAIVCEFDVEVDPWLMAGGIFTRRRLSTGTRIAAAATNNLLIDLVQLRALGVRFDARFGLSGGEDTLFTRSIVQRGGSIVWCNEARVTETVIASRATRRWGLGKAFSAGNAWTRTSIELAGPGLPRLLVATTAIGQGVARIGGGAARALWGKVSRSRTHEALGTISVARAVGMISGAVGHRHAFYRPG